MCSRSHDSACLISPQDLGRQGFRFLAIDLRRSDLLTILAFKIVAVSPELIHFHGTAKFESMLLNLQDRYIMVR